MSAWKSIQHLQSTRKRTSYPIAWTFGLGLALLVGAGTAHSQNTSKVTVYGVVDLGVEVSRAGEGNRQRMISGGSAGNRLGFQGMEDLGGGLTAQFKLEQGFTADDGQLAQGGRAFGRESSVGLSSRSLGTVSMGRIPMPYYLALNGIDAFSWTGSGGMLSLTQSGSSSRQLLPLAITARADNSISYVSPKLGGLEWRIQGAFSENSTTLGSLYSTSLRYRQGALDTLVAWARQYGAHSNAGNVTAWTMGGNYDLGSFKIYAGMVNERNNCSTCTGALSRTAGVTGDHASEFRMTNIGVRVPIEKWTGYAQVTRISDRSNYAIDTSNRNTTWVAIGAEYRFSKRTMVYGTLASIGNKNESNYALGSGTSQQPANFVAPGNPRASTFMIGMRHTF